ncbi:MAG: hypothetical protein ACFCUG_07750 [Thiotrichales bacterium]
MKLAVWLIGWVALMSALAGCGPVYKTVYHFEPPRDDNGIRCVLQCEETLRECSVAEDLRDENCRREQQVAELEHQRCRDLARAAGRKDDVCPRSYVSCVGGRHARCDENYRRCYENCGGQISSQQVCSMFCD